MRCPSEAVLAELVARTSAAGPAAELEAHVADCDDCRRLAFALASERDPAPRHAPARIGRFEILEELGAGAMGRVYRARDPSLDRAVAIKVHHGRAALDRDGDERLGREGQALARLSHPNVVAVHETGHDATTRYVVMEYVEGHTLERWCAGAPPLAERLAVLAGVARGLAAAHAVGLVHRDVKPSNVFVTSAGSATIAKIGDFGLARLEVGPAGSGERPAGAADPPDLMITLSLSGSLLGTPAYMAPEQLRGELATERSDQFGFCVTVVEALTGARPFAGRTLPELLAAIARGPEPAAMARLPARLRGAIARGLAADAAQRHASMAPLIDALAPPAARTRWFALGGLAGLIAAGVVIARPSGAEDACARADARLAPVFGPALLTAITAQFAARDPRMLREASVVSALLVGYGGRWRAAEATSCRASLGAPSPLRDRQRACLERQLARADDLGAILAQPSSTAPLAQAAPAVEALRDPQACLRATADTAEREAPSTPIAALVDAFDRKVDRLANLALTGRVLEAEEPAGLIAAVRELGAPDLLARALLAQAKLYAQRERFPELEGLLDEAAREAARAHDDTLVADAWTTRVFALREYLGRPDEARRWLSVADAAIVRAGDPPDQRARLHQIAGTLYADAGEHAQAEREMAAALAIRQRSQPTAVLALAASHGGLGLALLRAGKNPEARAAFERALALVRGTHGDLHPDVVANLINLGALLSGDDPPRAIAVLTEARPIAIQLSGPTSLIVAKSYTLEGIARDNLGEHAAAIPLFRKAFELARARTGPDHPSVAYAVSNLAKSELAVGEYAAAVRDAREALRILRKASGAQGGMVAQAHSGVGDALLRVGDAAGAIAEYQAALEAYAHTDEGGGEAAAVVRVDLAHIVAAAGDHVPARALFAQAHEALRDARGENADYRLMALAGIVDCDAAAGRVDRERLRALEAAAAEASALRAEVRGFVAFARARAAVALGQRAQAHALAEESRAAFAQVGASSDHPTRLLAALP